jgi:hypothetical protein
MIPYEVCNHVGPNRQYSFLDAVPKPLSMRLKMDSADIAVAEEVTAVAALGEGAIAVVFGHRQHLLGDWFSSCVVQSV